MRVGITVNFQHSFFSSGSPQTVLSIGEVIRFNNNEVIFINVDNKERTWWDDVTGLKDSWPQVHIDDLAEPLDCVIEVGSMLLTAEQRKRVNAKKYVWMNRKAALFHDIEASLYPFTKGKRDLDGVSEIWVYAELCNEYDVNYLELLTRKKVVSLPFIWTPSAIEFHRQSTQAPVWQQVAAMEGFSELPWSIHICETNNSSSSSCTIPLLIMREVRRAGPTDLNKSIKIHNADSIKTTEFFRFNVLSHCFSDITDMSGAFLGRQRVIDWVYDPKSIIIAHSRFISLRPYLFDCLWVGIPLIHNSKVLCQLGEFVSKGYYNDNEISQGLDAFNKVTAGVANADQLMETRKKILEEFSPLSPRIQSSWHAALLSEAPKAKAQVTEKVLRVGFSCMWDSFNPEYNMFTLMLENAAAGWGKVIGYAASPYSGERPDILIFGPFGAEWRDFPKTLPKIHFTGENTGPIESEDVVLNLGFRHMDMADEKYLRLPLWMLEINWFRADADRIGNPKPLPIDSCCKVEKPADSAGRDKFCAFVVTNARQPMRNSAFHWLSKYKRVDSAGRLYNNVGDQIFAGLGGGGGELKKHEFLKKYKFCLAYENESSPGYMTEKWLHAKAAGCVPIYWGDPKADRDFDMDSCIDAREAVTPKMLVDLVSAVDNDPEEYAKRYNKPALDEVRRDLVRRTLSECARRIWKAGGASEENMAKIPRFIGYTTDSEYPAPSSTAVSMDKTIFLTACNSKFLSSLHILLNSLLAQQQEIEELRAIVYLMDDVSKEVEEKFAGDFKFCEFRRFPLIEVAGFPDIWEPQHFAWKIWMMREICRDSSLAGLPVLYLDTGIMMCRWPREWLRKTIASGVCLLNDPEQVNKNWCHEEFVKRLELTNAELSENQVWAGSVSFIAGHPLAGRLLDDSWNLAQQRDLIVGAKWSGMRDGKPYGHRHDQSILSILSGRMKIPRLSYETIYCDVSLRQTFLKKKSLYVHRSLFRVHEPVATGIDDAWVINLDRRADRMQKFKAAHPDLAERTHRVSAFEARHLSLTPNLVRLFEPHDFNWKKPVMGCALSHLAMWVQLIEDREDIGSYLIMEDDVKLVPDWRNKWEKIHKNNALPGDWDIVYLGGILPPNKEVFHAELIEPVNEYIGRVKENQFFGQGKPNRYMHFCAYAYVLSRRGAMKVIEVMKAKGGYWTSADHMMCNIHEILKIYFTTPLIAGCFQDDDPVYRESQFNDFSRVDKFDSDLWNNTERFSAEEIVKNTRSIPLDISAALEDARRVCREACAVEAVQAVQAVETVQAVQAVPAVQAVETVQAVQAVPAVQAVETVQAVQAVPAVQAVETVQAVQAVPAVQAVETVQAVQAVPAVQAVETVQAVPAVQAVAKNDDIQTSKRRFVSLFTDMDMSQWHEFAWLKQLFTGISLEVERISENDLPADSPIVVVQRPYANDICRILTKWSSLGLTFYVLHMSDEFAEDRIDFYDLSGCKGVVRNYLRDDLPSNVATIPLGFHWAIPDGQPDIHTPRPPFRELVWSFVGTEWAGRREKLAHLEKIPGEHKLVYMDDWNSPKMLGREENLAILLNSWCVACPAGNNGETFRFYEALEAGAVPIVVQEAGMDMFFKMIGPQLPIMLANSWEHASQIIFTLKANPEVYEQYRTQLLNAWEVCKANAKKAVQKAFELP